MNDHFSILSWRLEQPTSPVLLTRRGPLTLYPIPITRMILLSIILFTPIWSLRISRDPSLTPILLIIRSTRCNFFFSLYQCSYPGGNFERNQQLNDSMSISPLNSNLNINLHVRTSLEPPPEFLQASFYSSLDRHLSGCINKNLRLKSKHIVLSIGPGCLEHLLFSLYLTFISKLF